MYVYVTDSAVLYYSVPENSQIEHASVNHNVSDLMHVSSL